MQEKAVNGPADTCIGLECVWPPRRWEDPIASTGEQIRRHGEVLYNLTMGLRNWSHGTAANFCLEFAV